ncbi:MAG: hypothetical protein VX583_11585 [Bdellovibrionota bacterium]|nr:hypothetical protein [Pseudobdellovibrionaceae bacterium]|tara:strand:- start:137189 stop:139024 length:1836 start_codon:yes stop_codon:yes gene_type:complete
MKKNNLILVSLFISLFCINAFSGAEKGNGQLSVKTADGQVIPFEEFVSGQHKFFRGYSKLPRTNNLNDPFERNYVPELDRWFEFISSMSEEFAKGLKQTAVSTDFIFLDSNISFKIEDYPIEDGLGVDYYKAAGFFENHIYISVPQMDEYTNSDRYTAEELRAFTIIHELLHPYSRKTKYTKKKISVPTKLQLGTFLLNIRKKPISKMDFLIETAKMGYHFWIDENIETRIQFIQQLKSEGRMRYLSEDFIYDSRLQYNLDKLNKLRDLLYIKNSKEPLSTLLPDYLSIRKALFSITQLTSAANSKEREELYKLFSRVTKDDFLYWLNADVFSAEERDSLGNIEDKEFKGLNYTTNFQYEYWIRERHTNNDSKYYFRTLLNRGFLLPFFLQYSPVTKNSDLELYENAGTGNFRWRHFDYDTLEYTSLITPYLIPLAQEYLRNWQPENLCSLESLRPIRDVNPLFLIYEQVNDNTWQAKHIHFQEDFLNHKGQKNIVSQSNSDLQSVYIEQYPEISAMMDKIRRIKKCIDAKESYSKRKLDYRINSIMDKDQSDKKSARELFKLRQELKNSEFATEEPLQNSINYMTQKIIKFCYDERINRSCSKLEIEFSK